MTRRYKLFGMLLLLLSFLILGAVVRPHTVRPRLSALRITEEEEEELRISRSETDRYILKSLFFNSYELFFDEADSTFYYSLVEKDRDASDPFVSAQGDTDGVQIALTDGEISAESIEQDLPLRIIAYDDATLREYKIRCTTLPLMNIESEIETIHGPHKDRDLKMTLFDNRAEARRRRIEMKGLIHIRGNSTTVFPKLDYKMTLYQTSPGLNDREADLAMLGMPRKDGEWILYAGYNDQERIRNVFSSALWNRSCAGENEFGIMNGMEYRYLELFLNGKYRGLYALGYPLDLKQMTPLRNMEKADSVYIYKKEFWDPAYSNLSQNLQMRDYQIRGKDALANETQARALLAEYDQWILDGAPGEASDLSGIRADMINAADCLLFVDLVQRMDTVESSGDFVNMFLTLVG